jgi:hypothetical protein
MAYAYAPPKFCEDVAATVIPGAPPPSESHAPLATTLRRSSDLLVPEDSDWDSPTVLDSSARQNAAASGYSLDPGPQQAFALLGWTYEATRYGCEGL